jgi:hypothetical protein
MTPTTNAGGRPRGSTKIRRSALLRAFNSTITPNLPELLQQATAWALAGDREAAAAILLLTADVMKLPDAQPAKPASCAACSF